MVLLGLQKNPKKKLRDTFDTLCLRFSEINYRYYFCTCSIVIHNLQIPLGKKKEQCYSSMSNKM